VTKTELQSKHLAELHALAAEAGVERYRLLPRAELIDRLADGSDAGTAESEPKAEGGRPRGERPRRQRRERRPREDRERRPREERAERESKPRDERGEPRPKPEPQIAPATTEGATTPPPASRPRRKRRRRWGRRGRKGLRVHDLLLPAAPGRQALVYAASREECTSLLRTLAAELADAADGADPIALLVDPSPEELADWRREAPQAEIVAAGQARHADDALAQAARRAGEGEAVIVLIDSLTRFAEAYGDGEEAKRLFDAGREATGSGSLTVVAAVERLH
jgi:transcription termination factor Rho